MSDKWGFDFDRAISTHEGSVVANVMLRELMEAMGEPIVARPVTPQAVWNEMLDSIRHRVTSGLPQSYAKKGTR